jgi:hypothetical protein
MSELDLGRCALTMTLLCNLKCKNCITYSPYYKNPKVYTFDMLKLGIDNFFDVINTVGNFVISGGEPLLNNALQNVVEYLKEHYYTRITNRIEIITNGTIVPSQTLLSACKEYDRLEFLVDNYSKDLSKKIDDVERVLLESNIKYRIRKYYGNDPHMGGWIDFSDLSLKFTTEAEKEDRFSRCAQIQKFNSCFPFPIVGGKVYPCPALRRCIELEKIPALKCEVLDLFDSSISIEERKEWFENLTKVKSLSACAYCYGMSDDAPRVTPGEQLND